MKILKRYPETGRARPMAIVELNGRYLELRYLYLTEEDRAVFAHLSDADARSYVAVRAGSGRICRRGLRCRITGRILDPSIPSAIDLPLDGDPTETFDRFLQDLEAYLAEAVL